MCLVTTSTSSLYLVTLKKAPAVNEPRVVSPAVHSESEADGLKSDAEARILALNWKKADP